MEHMVCLRCDTNNSRQWTPAEFGDYLNFTTNLDCIILGIHVFGSYTYSGKHDIRLTIVKSIALGSINTVIISEKRQEIYPVMFGSPLLVEKNTRYTIYLKMNGPNTFMRKSYKEIAALNELFVTFLRSSYPSNKTNEIQEQIPGIIIQHIYQK
jgi:hypothetical protein